MVLKFKELKMTKNKIISVSRLISKAEKSILLGFSEENFEKTADVLNILSQCVEPQEWRLLNEFWRDSYTDSCDSGTLNTVCKQLKQKYKNQHTKH
jgi:hypothetical protein